MKTSLSPPKDKQEELQALTKIITEKVAAEMVILFGSHARGDWVENFQEHTEYVSDYDVLVITKDRKSAKADEKWWNLKKLVNHNGEQTNVSLINHGIGFVNNAIEQSQYSIPLLEQFSPKIHLRKGDCLSFYKRRILILDLI